MEKLKMLDIHSVGIKKSEGEQALLTKHYSQSILSWSVHVRNSSVKLGRMRTIKSSGFYFPPIIERSFTAEEEVEAEKWGR